MTLSAVATRYAKALADVTTAAAGLRPELRPEDALSQLRAFESALAASRELQNALTTPAIPHACDLIVDERLGCARAEVSSPRELTETQRGAINAQLERITGKRIRMRYAVDPALIGGVVARIGSTVYDGSVRGQLQTLGRRLATER